MMLYCLSCDYHGIESTTGPAFSSCPQCHGTAWSNDPNRVIRPKPPENAALYTVQDLWNGDVKLTREQRMWIRQALDAQMDADPT